MDKHEFEQFVTEHGKDILRFCRMNAGSTERGNELYQDTMVKLLEKQKEGKMIFLFLSRKNLTAMRLYM